MLYNEAFCGLEVFEWKEKYRKRRKKKFIKDFDTIIFLLYRNENHPVSKYNF